MKKSKRKNTPEPIVQPKPLVFDTEKIGRRLRHVDIGAFVRAIENAIHEAKGMAGSMHPDDCEIARSEYDALLDVVNFVFEKGPA